MDGWTNGGMERENVGRMEGRKDSKIKGQKNTRGKDG